MYNTDANTAALNRFEIAQLRDNQWQIDQEVETLIQDRIIDVEHEDTGHALLKCKDTFRNLMNHKSVDNIYNDLTPAKMMSLVLDANELIKAMEREMKDLVWEEAKGNVSSRC